MSQDPNTLIENVKRYFDQHAHDTKNLLNYLVLWLDMPERDKSKDEVRSLLLEIQQTYTTKIDEFRGDFEQFLSIATTGTAPTKIESLSSWISSVLDNYWNQYDAPGKLIKELDSNISLTYPPSYLRSILRSLLENAIQYRTEERELLIQVKLYLEGDEVVVQVRDNGIGIDLERHRNTLFQPFHRFSNRGEGKGLSLHLVKTMVEKNGGKVQLESSLGEGTTLEVHLKGYESKE